MFNVGAHNHAAYKPVADFLLVLPDIKNLGSSLRAGQHSNIDQIVRLASEDKIGDPEGDSLCTLVQGLAVAALASPSQGKTLALPYPI